MSTPLSVLCLLAGLVATALAGLRWLRVAQREHYLGGSADRFATRWWPLGPNRVLAAAAIIGLGLAALGVTPAGIVAAAAVAVGPFGLSIKGRTSKLAWTRRLRTRGCQQPAGPDEDERDARQQRSAPSRRRPPAPPLPLPCGHGGHHLGHLTAGNQLERVLRGPRVRIGDRVFKREVNLERAGIDTPNPLDDMQFLAMWMTDPI